MAKLLAKNRFVSHPIPKTCCYICSIQDADVKDISVLQRIVNSNLEVEDFAQEIWCDAINQIVIGLEINLQNNLRLIAMYMSVANFGCGKIIHSGYNQKTILHIRSQHIQKEFPNKGLEKDALLHICVTKATAVMARKMIADFLCQAVKTVKIPGLNHDLTGIPISKAIVIKMHEEATAYDDLSTKDGVIIIHVMVDINRNMISLSEFQKIYEVLSINKGSIRLIVIDRNCYVNYGKVGGQHGQGSMLSLWLDMLRNAMGSLEETVIVCVTYKHDFSFKSCKPILDLVEGDHLMTPKTKIRLIMMARDSSKWLVF